MKEPAAAVGGWERRRTGMGGCWESERGCRERGRQTDRQQKTSKVQKSLFNSVYQSKRTYSVHTPNKHEVTETALYLLLKLYLHTEHCSILCNTVTVATLTQALNLLNNTPRDKTNILSMSEETTSKYSFNR